MDTLFFLISKIIWLFLSPDGLLLILILLTLGLLYLGKNKQAKILLATISGILLTLSFLSPGEWLLYPLESRFTTNPVLPEQVDGIIVLSGAENPLLSSVWNQVELGAASERVLAFLALARKYPDAKLVFTGGTGSLILQEYKAADVAKKLFEQQSFDTTRIIFERESRNTYENVVYSKKLVHPLKNKNWILITTSWHMPRSVGIFCQAGWPVIPYPVDHETNKDNLFRIDFNLLDNLQTLRTAIKEWLGLIAYYVSGKTNAFFPDQCQ
ncbi:MAG: YdcF family protein [Gammaproteobacteria bacterium]|nr:YdcF family protein [Gammaproteobacteria bacterium]